MPFLPVLPVTQSKSLLKAVKRAGHHSQSLPSLGAHSQGRRTKGEKAPLSTCCTPLSQPEAPLNESRVSWRRRVHSSSPGVHTHWDTQRSPVLSWASMGPTTMGGQVFNVALCLGACFTNYSEPPFPPVTSAVLSRLSTLRHFCSGCPRASQPWNMTSRLYLSISGVTQKLPTFGEPPECPSSAC